MGMIRISLDSWKALETWVCRHGLGGIRSYVAMESTKVSVYDSETPKDEALKANLSWDETECKRNSAEI